MNSNERLFESQFNLITNRIWCMVINILIGLGQRDNLTVYQHKSVALLLYEQVKNLEFWHTMVFFCIMYAFMWLCPILYFIINSSLENGN